MSDAAIAGEKVGAEHESKTLAVETHVSVGVAGEKNRPQAVPNVDEVAVVEPAVRNEGAEGQDGPADALQTTGDSCPTAIVRMAGVVLSVETRGGNPSASLARNRRDIENVVEVPVGDDDATNQLVLPAAPAKGAMQKETSANESSIEQIKPRCVSKDVEVDRGCSDLKDIGTQRRVYGLS